MEDQYKTIIKPGESLYKDRGSKFFGFAFHITREDELKAFIKSSRKEHHTARHHCYAFRVNPRSPSFRGSDDGESSNSAGTPILNQIYSHDLYDVGIVVVRYFGGTKLGVPGLINAYKNAAIEAVENASVVTQLITENISFSFEYADINKIMRVIKEHNLNIIEQNSMDNMTLTLGVKRSDVEKIRHLIFKLNCVTFEK